VGSNGRKDFRAVRRPGLLNFLKACDELPYFTAENVHEHDPRHRRKSPCLCNSGRACRRAFSDITAQTTDILLKEFFRLALQLLQNTHLIPMLRVLQRLAQGVEERFSGYFTLKELFKRSQVLF
jgi:hypothetical protein